MTKSKEKETKVKDKVEETEKPEPKITEITPEEDDDSDGLWKKGDKVTVRVTRKKRLVGGEIIGIHDTGEEYDHGGKRILYLVRYPANIGSESKLTSGWFEGHNLREGR